MGDVVPNPAERGHQVGHPDVGRIGIRRTSNRGDIEEPEHVETVIDRHAHDIMMPSHLRPVLRGQFVSRTEGVAAAVDVEHHRAFALEARCPHVHLEHVLALPAVGPLLKERLLARPVMKVLRTIGAVGQGRVFTLPRRGRSGRKPSVLPPGVGAVRNSLEGQDSILDIPAHLPVLRAGDRRPRSTAARRRRPGRAPFGASARGAGCSHPRGHARRSGEQQGLPTIESTAVLRLPVHHSASSRFFPGLCHELHALQRQEKLFSSSSSPPSNRATFG